MNTCLLFPAAMIPRTPPIKRMHVTDAGMTDFKEYPLWFRFECSHCDYHEEGAYKDITVTEAKRGLPCPVCNKSEVKP